VPDLTIRIKKKTDGTAALTCTRADGSTTWQRQEKQLGAFFPLHDLTHCAVESVLGFDRAFFGLIAEGWEISDFAGTGVKSRLPTDALLAELIVGFIDLEQRTGHPMTAGDCNAKINEFVAAEQHGLPGFPLDEVKLAAIRGQRDELFAQWRGLQPGEALEVPFTRRSVSSAA
jgi:hypothetical protein